ncbi:MAG: imidazole glycerol phosphate synthase subunit HisH [Phycisphaerales bacterium]|nr:imidazole glycerol phosphate synthase subunit HisH [Phycisphaerales bacterium]MCH2153676.1 imidazole glycerol phosphate synthase subunit HisH [Phycisphaerales bacterium]
MTEVGIVDYGAGNIASVENILSYIGAETIRVATPEQIQSCERLILPGVGAAGQAVDRLRSSGLDQALHEAVLDRGVPFLGICLGMQLLADKLHEFGEHDGLGWIPGSVVHLSEAVGERCQVPHTGWSSVCGVSNSPVIKAGLSQRSEFYFSHSFVFRPAREADVAATFDYHGSLVAAVGRENIIATQFHPEKSQIAGQRLLEEFLDWSP